MSEVLLRVRGVKAWYGPSQALHGIDLEVRRGELVTLLGRNGAGKTTLLKAIMGLVPRRAGSIEFMGRELIAEPAHVIGRCGLALCPDDRSIFASLTVSENLRLPPVIAEGGMSEQEIYELFPNLKERASSSGTQLSGGEQQMLAIARILRSGARLLLLDEPTEGLAPAVVDRIGELILKLKQRGYTVVLVEQNVEFAASISDRHYLIETGRVLQQLNQAQLDAEYDWVAERLGL